MASDDKILVDKADSLTKAVRKNEPASNIIPILEYFKKIPPPNEDALRVSLRARKLFPPQAVHV